MCSLIVHVLSHLHIYKHCLPSSCIRTYVTSSLLPPQIKYTRKCASPSVRSIRSINIYQIQIIQTSSPHLIVLFQFFQNSHQFIIFPIDRFIQCSDNSCFQLIRSGQMKDGLLLNKNLLGKKKLQFKKH